MSAHNVAVEIIARMRNLFAPARAMDAAEEQSALAEYVDALKDYDAGVLANAWVSVRDSHVARSWPAVGRFTAAARAAVQDRANASGGLKVDREAQARQKRWNFWKANRNGEMARDAAREGWAWSLKLYVLDHGVLPFGTPLSTMRLYALKREQNIAATCDALSTENAIKARLGFERVAQHEAETREEVLRVCEAA